MTVRLCRTSMSTMMPPAASPIPTVTTASTVSRTRIVVSRPVQRLATIGIEPVTNAAHGANRASAERHIDLAAKVSDVYLEHVRVVGERRVPHFVHRESLGDDLPRPGHE